MKVFELLEGGVKRRTDPRLSGEDTSSRSSAGPWEYPAKTKVTSHEAQIQKLADKGKVSFTIAANAWDSAMKQVGSSVPNRYARVMVIAKKTLRITEAEDKPKPTKTKIKDIDKNSSLDDLFSRYGLDHPLAKVDRKEPPKHDEPREREQKLKAASADTTKSRMKGVSIDAAKAPKVDFKNIDTSKEIGNDEAARRVGAPGHDEPKLLGTNKIENLPKVISTAMVTKGTNLAKVDPADIEWHQVKNLPGYMQKPIRAIGRQVFHPFTKTPIEDIQVLANVGNGPNSKAEVEMTKKFINANGHRMNEYELEFNEVFKDYGAKVEIHNCLGYTFMSVKDFAGIYIYSWPSKDTKEINMPGGNDQLPSSKKLLPSK